MSQVHDEHVTPDPPADGGARRTGLGRRVAGGLGVLAFAALCIAAMAGGATVLHLRAQAEAGPEPNPIIGVRTAALDLQDKYRIEQAFVGRIEPARETQLAFELAGTVMDIVPDEGDPVRAGDVVAKLDTDKLGARQQELNAQRNELEASLRLARATSERQSTLQRQGWAADQRYDEARFRVLELESAVARIDAAIQSVAVDLEKSVLRAPFSGRVASRSVDEGAIVASGAPVVRLLETERAQIRVGLSQAAAGRLKLGQTYTFLGTTGPIRADLVRLRPDLDPRSRTVTALFDIEAPNGLIFGGVATLALEQVIDVAGAWVPLTALSEGEKGLWTLLTVGQRDGNQIVEREAVEVLHVSDGRAFIRGSIVDGTRYVVDGTNRIVPGQRVAQLPSDKT